MYTFFSSYSVIAGGSEQTKKAFNECFDNLMEKHFKGNGIPFRFICTGVLRQLQTVNLAKTLRTVGLLWLLCRAHSITWGNLNDVMVCFFSIVSIDLAKRRYANASK